MFFLISGLPLALYLLILAMINRRPRALMVSGPWDFLGVVFAVSGFLCLGGPVLMTSLNERARRFWVMGQNDGAFAASEQQYRLWIMLFSAYFLLIVLGAAFLLWRRRSATAIYNIDHEIFGGVLGSLLDSKAIRFQQIGNVLYLKAAGVDNAMSGTECSVEVDPSPRLRHITLQWEPSDSPLRQDIEKELESRLREVPAPDNPTGDWLMVVSGILFLAWLIGLGIIALYWILQR